LIERMAMSEILFIKTSSLGDVIHHMPALTDARRECPHARFTWVVEETYAPLVKLHPAADAVIPVASRRWRKRPVQAATWREMGDLIRTVRGRDYDQIIDTQGLVRSALISKAARGARHGYDSRSIREPVASMFYDVRHQVSRDLHAVERNRLLTGLALGYAPFGAPDYGLNRRQLAGAAAPPYGVLLHGTAQARKQWPVENWIAFGTMIARQGHELVLPWGTEAERKRAGQIAMALPNARVGDQLPLDDMAKLIAGASFVVGVDTGLLHLAAALGIPLVAIFGASEPGLTGPAGAGPISIVGANASPPSVADVLDAFERTVPS
jgi:heptosyltransferase-1